MWFKVDDHFHDHRKLWGADLAAVGLWTMAGSWAGANKTDGFIPASVVPRWSKSWRKLAADLVARGLWAPAEQGGADGWQFVNWTEWQPSVEETDVPVERLRWRRKQALKKNRVLCDQIVERDRGLCRYCAQRVNWADRKSARGATYDHVDPDGDNSLENVVVACRRCNGRKKDRTPAEAGMVLLPVPSPYESGSDLAPEVPDRSGDSGSLARETGRDQIGSSSVRVGSRSSELDLRQTNGHHANGAHA